MVHAYLDASLHQTPDEPLKLAIFPATHRGFEDGEQPDHALEQVELAMVVIVVVVVVVFSGGV